MCQRDDWEAALASGHYPGSGDDLRDGFMHFSNAEQVAESAARHRAGITDLMLIGVDADDLGASLKWEPSRGGQLFPHLFGGLDTAKVLSVHELPLDEEGYHIFPDGIPSWRPDVGICRD